MVEKNITTPKEVARGDIIESPDKHKIPAIVC